MSIFELLVFFGALLTLAGFAGLIWCIVKVWRARRANLPDAEMRAVMQSVLPMNFGALALSVMGLMLVVIGVFLG